MQQKRKVDVFIFVQDCFRITNIQNTIRLPKQVFHLLLFSAWFRSIRVCLNQFRFRASYLFFRGKYPRVFNRFRR